MPLLHIAGLPPITGLWASLLPLVVYALVGTSPQLSLGPESTTALMTATTLVALSNGDPNQVAAIAGALAIVTGLVCIAGRLVRAGYLSTFLSRPMLVLSRPMLVGYLLGIALLMVASQLGRQLGYVVSHLSEINLATVIMSVGMLVLLFVGGRLLPRLPWTLIAMLLAAGIAAFGHLERYGIELVGPIPAE